VGNNGAVKHLVIVSEKTRGHFQHGINEIKLFKVTHFYKSTFSDMDTSATMSGFTQYKNIFDLYEKLKKAKPDLIQPLEPYYGWSRFGLPWRVLPIMITVYIFCWRNNVPYFFHFLENIPPDKKYRWPFSKIMYYFARILTERAMLLFYANKGARKNILRLGGGKKSQYGLWGVWGVDRKQFYPAKKKVKNNVLFVGRIIAQKGVFDLIKAFSSVTGKVAGARLVIVGVGAALTDLRQEVAKYNLQKAVSFVGEVRDKEVKKYYRKGSVFVFPSKSERWSQEQVGMVAIEAMASGLPIVAYNSGSIGEFIKNNKTGILVKEGDIIALARGIIKLLTSKKRQSTFSVNSLALVKEKYDLKKNVTRLERILLKQLNEK